jgi:hypothetical protein
MWGSKTGHTGSRLGDHAVQIALLCVWDGLKLTDFSWRLNVNPKTNFKGPWHSACVVWGQYETWLYLLERDNWTEGSGLGRADFKGDRHLDSYPGPGVLKQGVMGTGVHTTSRESGRLGRGAQH